MGSNCKKPDLKRCHWLASVTLPKNYLIQETDQGIYNVVVLRNIMHPSTNWKRVCLPFFLPRDQFLI
ncbi:hypothetical protein PE36_20679 [Moritella sp. PE36]|nr:hypothetical protein PE36_20679 [Moritella sp. PE36]